MRASWPRSLVRTRRLRCRLRSRCLERVQGIEPSYDAWEAAVRSEPPAQAILAALAERCDELGCDEASRVTSGCEPTTPVMCGAAGLHGNRAYGQLLGPSLKGLALEDATFHSSAVQVQYARCDHILGQVQANSSKLIHDFPFRYRLTTGISIVALDAVRLQRRGGTGKSLPVEKLRSRGRARGATKIDLSDRSRFDERDLGKGRVTPENGS